MNVAKILITYGKVHYSQLFLQSWENNVFIFIFSGTAGKIVELRFLALFK